MSFWKSLKDIFFTKYYPMEPGVFHFQAPPEAEIPYRLHLRIEEDGQGILIVNASTILHLNQTATEYAYHLVNQTSEEQMVNEISKRYPISRNQAKLDFADFSEKILFLLHTPDLDPVSFLGFERQDPYSGKVYAPYRLDCALTYQTLDESSSLYAPVKRVDRELTTEEWKVILDKSWEAGIPHIVFTGGEPTIRPDLPELILHSEELGQVTGLLTNGNRLTEKGYLQKLLQNGLDHILLVLDPTSDQAWEAIRDSIAEDIFVTVHITLTDEIAAAWPSLIEKIASFQVKSLSLSTQNESLGETLQAIREKADELEIDLHWDLPVPYSRQNPVSLEIEESEDNNIQETHLDGAGSAWLYIEPDGDVLAAQGLPKVLGNMLTDEWSAIWKPQTN